METDEYVDFTGKLYRNPEFSKQLTKLYVKTKEGKLIITVKGRLKGFHRGDIIEGSARFYPTDHPCNFGVDRKNLFLAQGILTYGYSKSGIFFRKLKNGMFSFFYSLKEKAALKILSLQSPYSSIASALLLGQRYNLGENQRRALKLAGIYHLLAISGAHVGLFLYLVWLVSGLFTWKTMTKWYIELFSLLIFYLWMEGSPSVDRATLIAILIIVGKLLWRDIDYVNLLFASMLISLFLHPLSFLSPGFQLTYFVTFGIVLFLKHINGKGKIYKLFMLSLVAYIFSLPITLFHFHRTNLLSPFNNIITAAILPFLILLLILWSAGFSFLYLPVKFIADIIFTLDAIKFSIFTVPAIPLFLVVAISLLLFIAPRKNWVLVLPLFLIFYPGERTNQFEVIFLDVGQGDSVLVRCPPKVFLYDGGGSKGGRFDVGEYVVSQALWKQGIRKLDAIFVSHYHPDHAGGLLSILENFPYGKFYIGEVADKDPLYLSLISKIDPEKLTRLKKGNKFPIGSCTIEVLHPPEITTDKTKNNDSLVLLVNHNGTKVLLTGDIGASVENKILSNLPEIDILKVAHHGSATSSSEKFLSKAKPKISIVSAGKFNSYGLPAPVVIKRLKRHSKFVFITSKSGAVKVQKRKLCLCLDSCKSFNFKSHTWRNHR